MAESSPGRPTLLSPLQAPQHPRRTYSAAFLAELVNHQYRFTPLPPTGATARLILPMASASARVAGRAPARQPEVLHGSEPDGCSIPISPTSTRRSSTCVVNVGVRDPTYVPDGLLYHESDLRIEEHYTDMAGFT